ncbi:MAG: hypothetical protein C0391_06670 [Anaerolinea sp.]|nr:hypothetical protein [Anaerolinea sp.]
MANINSENPVLIRAILFLQIIPLLLFPPSTFDLKSQTWWLPAILVLLVIVGTSQLLRKTTSLWPLYLVAFAQGFNIISRLLMLMPQSVAGTEGGEFNALYFVLSIISMAASTFFLWYIEKPSVKQALGR